MVMLILNVSVRGCMHAMNVLVHQYCSSMESEMSVKSFHPQRQVASLNTEEKEASR